MTGQSVSYEKGASVVREGAFVADYAGVRVYTHGGFHYFIPECVWRPVVEERKPDFPTTTLCGNDEARPEDWGLQPIMKVTP